MCVDKDSTHHHNVCGPPSIVTILSGCAEISLVAMSNALVNEYIEDSGPNILFCLADWSVCVSGRRAVVVNSPRVNQRTSLR